MSALRILIADHYPVVRRGLRSLLESHAGWEVCAEAANGHEALALAQRLKPDVVILAFTMPQLNGLEAARRIVKSVPRVEVLILSMHASDAVVHQALRAGARGVLLKSDNEADLIRAVERLSEHKLFSRSSVPNSLIATGSPTNQDEPYMDPTTPRELEILQLLAEGKSNKEVANALGVSVRTIENHRARLMHKLNLHSTSELVRYAIRNYIIEP